MGKRILVFSDLHGDIIALERLLDMEADAYIAAGDLCNWGRGLDALAYSFKRRADKLWILPGNHESSVQIDAYCEKHGLQSLHKRSFELGGYHIAGLGHSNPTPFATPGEDSEETIAANLQAFAELRPLVLVCHCPPYNTPLDQGDHGRHYGSQSIADFITKYQPKYFFSGHVHEAAGRKIQFETTWGYAVGKAGELLELPERRQRPSAS